MNILWQKGVDDIEAVFAPTSDWHSDLFQLSAGLLGYRACSVFLADVTLHYETLDKPIRSLQQMRKQGFYAGFVLAAEQPVRWKGQEVHEDIALVFGREDHDLVLPAGCVLLGLEVDGAAAVGTGLVGLEPGLWRCHPEALRRFHTTCKTLAETPGFCLTAQEQNVLRNRVLSQFLAALAGPTQTQPSRLFDIMRRAEEFAARQGWSEGVAIDSLADEIAVPRRTLHRSFKDLYGIGPQGYLRLVRLHLFRQALLTGAQAGIADAALSAGFEHFGRAAQYYRQQFGELPKQTLKRALES